MKAFYHLSLWPSKKKVWAGCHALTKIISTFGSKFTIKIIVTTPHLGKELQQPLKRVLKTKNKTVIAWLCQLSPILFLSIEVNGIFFALCFIFTFYAKKSKIKRQKLMIRWSWEFFIWNRFSYFELHSVEILQKNLLIRFWSDWGSICFQYKGYLFGRVTF